ncbi:rRNA-processing protein FCF1 [Echinococcus granulosus]|uniref:rRNA-processing protein FCF1 n=1 Tax=Echinococcus granulosus TaxID=6210 RepID=W6V9M9_ECHGR|nr:rRNA-processing protein FCF1 [Echinococcus granulosus]EUB63359.1 rRNA-processing protein FCF1 [Echinococcus granulosus]
MGKRKQTRKFAVMKKTLNLKDNRIKKLDRDKLREAKKAAKAATRMVVKNRSELVSCLRDSYNEALGPPYHILLDTNYVNFSIKNRLDLFSSIMDCLLAKCFLYVTDCVMGEIEKMPERYRVALRQVLVGLPDTLLSQGTFYSFQILRDPRIERLTCQHKGTYADDCLVERCQARCYIVATCDRDLRRRIRKITGVPIMYIHNHRVTIEKMPMALGAPKI